MGRQRAKDRVIGPYLHGKKYRVIVLAYGQKHYQHFETEREASDFIKCARRELFLDATTIQQAIEEYELFMRSKCKPLTARSTIDFLSRFFDDKTLSINNVDKKIIEKNVLIRSAKVATDTVASELRTSKTFLRWCAYRGWVSRGLIAQLGEIKVVGRRSKGKKQLTIDESRKYLKAAIEGANAGEIGCVVAMCPLLLGIRSREILDRQIRDLDDDGKVLWIRDAKTDAGNRRILIPDVLKHHLIKLSIGKTSEDYLIPGRYRGRRATTWLNKWVGIVCARAGVVRVCAHGLRGTHATLATSIGVSSRVVAESLGHVSDTITHEHYIKRDSKINSAQQATWSVINVN